MITIVGVPVANRAEVPFALNAAHRSSPIVRSLNSTTSITFHGMASVQQFAASN